MQAKAFLMQRRNLEIRLKVEERKLQQVRINISNLSAIDYAKDKIQGNSQSDVADSIIKLESQQTKYMEVFRELERIRDNVDNVINKIQDLILYSLIYYRYVEAMSWRATAELINNSESNTKWRLHKRALDVVDKILNCDESEH